MFAATVRGMITHKLRLALTTLSIALGVAFVAGTLILTDTMTLAFDLSGGSRHFPSPTLRFSWEGSFRG